MSIIFEKRQYGVTFCRIFIHKLVVAPLKAVKTLEMVICFSRDVVLKKEQKELADKTVFPVERLD
jgi:hypothetical protein